MCDYSLNHVATRPGKLEDKLVTTKFSITHGFAAVGEPHVAVCLLPGTELAFDEVSSADRYSTSASCRARRLDSDLPASGRLMRRAP